MRKPTLLLGLVILLTLGTKTNYCQNGFWTEETHLLITRNLLSTSEVNGTIYAFGGAVSPTASTALVEAYDTTAKIWSYKKNLPQAICGAAVCTVNGKIYIIGGALSLYGEAVSSTYEYIPALDSFVIKRDIPQPVELAAAGTVDGKIYVIGGAPTGWDTAYTTVYEYNPESDTWLVKTGMPTARFCHTATVLDGKIYVFGGAYDNSLVALQKAEVYDPLADEWDTITPLPAPRSLHGACAVNGLIYIFGGGPDKFTVFGNVEEYNPVQDSWTSRDTMPTPRWGLSSSVSGSKIFAIGGADSLNQGSSAVEVYHPPVNPSDIIDSENSDSPDGYLLDQNYPNPFNPGTNIKYSISELHLVTLEVFDVLGNKIETLVNEEKPAGTYELTWNSVNLPSGVYFYQIRAGEFTAVKKMILLR